MRLVDLDPRFVGAGGDGVTDHAGNPVPARHGIGLSFLCPCPVCTPKRKGNPDDDFHLRHFVEFTNPLDDGPVLDADRPHWLREGDTFETMTLQPSILSRVDAGGCGWHGYVGGPGADRPGEVVTL